VQVADFAVGNGQSQIFADEIKLAAEVNFIYELR
jgi:hypothetical protein